MKKSKVRLGGVILDAHMEENVDYTAEVTSKPVEKGEDISDHMKPKPFSAKLSGSMIKDAEAKFEALKQYQKEAQLISFVGKSSLENVVITSLSRSESVENYEGYDYDITIEEVRIASPETFKVSVKNPKSGKQDKKTATKVKASTDEGRKQVSRK